MKHTCGWRLPPDNRRCDKPTKYVIVRDDDNNKVRKYHPWCEEHRPEAERMQREEEERGEA